MRPCAAELERKLGPIASVRMSCKRVRRARGECPRLPGPSGTALGSRQVLAIVSSESQGRMGDSIIQSGIDHHSFIRGGGTVLWQHDYNYPVARTLRMNIVNGCMTALTQFPPEGTSAQSDECYRLIREGIVNAIRITPVGASQQCASSGHKSAADSSLPGYARNCRRGGSHMQSGSPLRASCAGENKVADLEIIPCTIPAGQTVSAPVGIGFKTVVGFVMPAVRTSGALTFRASPDCGASFLPFVAVLPVDSGGRPARCKISRISDPSPGGFAAIISRDSGASAALISSGTEGAW
jgi:hypothetical protein